MPNRTTSESLESAGLSESAVLAIIRERIEKGIYGPGVRLPAERVLASEFGVSRSTARSVYSRLAELGLVEQSHYRRPYVSFNGQAKHLQPGSEIDRSVATELKTIAAILPSDPVFPGGLALVAGVHNVLADLESPYRLTFLDTYNKDRPEVVRREIKAIRSAIDENVAGLIWWYFSPEETVVQFVREHPDLPIVFIDRYPSELDCDFAGIDDVECSRMAVEYLMELGHKRIAHLMDPGNYSTIIERATGYREAFMARGLPVPEDLIFHLEWADNSSKITNTEQAFDYLYSLAEPPTALFTSNDYIAHRFIKIAESKGIRVPDDLSVVGHGNVDRYAPRDEFLTSVDQPFEQIGKSAAKLLLKRISAANGQRQSFQHIVLQASLVVRNSCRELQRPTVD